MDPSPGEVDGTSGSLMMLGLKVIGLRPIDKEWPAMLDLNPEHSLDALVVNLEPSRVQFAAVSELSVPDHSVVIQDIE